MSSRLCPPALFSSRTERVEPIQRITAMKKMILGLALVLGLSGTAWAAGASIPMDKAPQRTNDMAALQNGAKLFVNYCLNCHSASFMRFNRMRDIGLTDKQIAENLTFTTDKIGDTMKVSMTPTDAKAFLVRTLPTSPWWLVHARRLVDTLGLTTFTLSCVPTTATPPRRPAGTTRPTRPPPCPIRSGSYRVCNNLFTTRCKAKVMRLRCCAVGNRPSQEPCRPLSSIKT